MAPCYQGSGYRWMSFSVFISASIAMLTVLIIDMTMNGCNDPYHDITNCINSTSCDVRYCEESICANYTCLPRIKKWCVHNEMVFYPEGECPEPKKYNTSMVVLCLLIVIFLDAFIYMMTIIHFRYNYYYSNMYMDDGAVPNPYIADPRVNKVKCGSCNGVGDDIVNGIKCKNCNGKGNIIIDNYRD